ncbi:MAG: B12-binding domain-containing protein [Gammaproteobacteria bacterium]|nr:B12-binding domain-containing protein [Gammaproteobacteria bacterium]
MLILSTAETTPAQRVAAIIEAIEQYRIADCDRLVAEAREGLGPCVLVREVFGPVLREAGDRWEQGRFSVAQEHMLSNAVRRQLTYSLDEFNRLAPAEPCVAYTTLSGERHEMGSLMLAVLGASFGVRAMYLGPDLPVVEVGRFCNHVPVVAIAISIVTNPDVIDAADQLCALREALPVTTRIWLGGQAAGRLPTGQLPWDCTVITDIADFELRVTALRKQGP